MSKGQSDNTNNAIKSLIAQRLRTDRRTNVRLRDGITIIYYRTVISLLLYDTSTKSEYNLFLKSCPPLQECSAEVVYLASGQIRHKLGCIDKRVRSLNYHLTMNLCIVKKWLQRYSYVKFRNLLQYHFEIGLNQINSMDHMRVSDIGLSLGSSSIMNKWNVKQKLRWNKF